MLYAAPEAPTPAAGAIGGGASELRASFRRRGMRTALADTYFTSPLKVAKAFPVETGDGGGAPSGGVGAAVIVMDVSPGLMDGDVYSLEWDVGEGCSAAVTTQSYAKVHPCPRRGAAQSTAIAVGPGASLVYAPQPTMLYADASLRSTLRVDLAEGASLLLFDTLCAGRIHYAGGEAFRFRRYESELLVKASGCAAAAGRMRLVPAEQTLSSVGLFEDATHIGTMYGFGPFVGRGALEALQPVAARELPGVRCGISLTARYGLAATAIGRSAREVQEALYAVGRAFVAYADAHAPASCARFAWSDALHNI